MAAVTPFLSLSISAATALATGIFHRKEVPIGVQGN
jgi:hypothetical protein